MNQSENINELAKALVNAQKVMGVAIKDSSNPFFKSKYADLESVWEACRKPLTDNGLCVVQTTRESEKGICVVTTLLHISGQWIKGELTLRPVKDDPQAAGSAITYARRYALAAIVGVYQADDDANKASGKEEVKRVVESNPTNLLAHREGPVTAPSPLPTKESPLPETEFNLKLLFTSGPYKGLNIEQAFLKDSVKGFEFAKDLVTKIAKSPNLGEVTIYKDYLKYCGMN